MGSNPKRFDYSPDPSDELVDLAWDLSQGTIDSDRMERLNSMLVANPACRAKYVRLMNVIAFLEHEEAFLQDEHGHDVRGQVVGAHPIGDDGMAIPGVSFVGGLGSGLLPSLDDDVSAGGCCGPVPPIQMSIWHRFRTIAFSPLVVAACASLLTLGGISIWNRSGPERVAPPIAVNDALDSATTPVAYLASAVGDSWGTETPSLTTLGSPVRLGEQLTLEEGIAEFRLVSGVVLSIEGPAVLVLTSPQSMLLQHGRVTVYVPWEAGGFKLATSGCRLEANDAEFGVSVSGGDFDVHVFSGNVELSRVFHGEPASPYGDMFAQQLATETDLPSDSELTRVVVGSGRGIDLSCREDVITVKRWHEADASEFATKLSMAGSLPIGQKYVDSVLASGPIGYWRFEQINEGRVGSERAGVPDLVVSGDLQVVAGGGNSVIEFGRTGSKGFLVSETPFNLPPGSDYTVEAWFKPSHVHDGNLIAIVTDTEEGVQEAPAFCVQIASAARHRARIRQRIRFLHRDPPSFNASTGTACYSDGRYLARRWQHIAAVKEGTQIKLYLDGKLVATETEPALTSLAPKLKVIVGQWGISEPEIPFVGQMDELAVYDHALSQAEIRRHIGSLRKKPTLPRTISYTDI